MSEETGSNEDDYRLRVQQHFMQHQQALLAYVLSQNISEAAASGAAQVTTLGDSGWRNVTARSLVPDDVSYAVVHLASRPKLRVPMPNGLIVDHARFKLKTRPILPERDAHAEK